MFHRLLSYLKFLWHSKNEHGVHSPFIFKYVTQCLYRKNKFADDKVENIVLKSLDYFQCGSITVVPAEHPLALNLKKVRPHIHMADNSSELIFISDCDDSMVETYLLKNKNIGNNTIGILKGIYKNKENTQLWDQIKTSDRVRVTVDLYYCAVIFFRREQVEEHFKIRI
ncbi:hypothetical protein [Sediminicola sp. 1XM1-17]|uniref:hypothetical protein n=1 Tax=Sediminicola sp. 1XM1-17 TaxID=3127702 RepID=UPI0030769128